MLDQTTRTAQATLDCRNTLYVNSIQDYWQTALPEVFGEQYQPANTVFFARPSTPAAAQAD